MEKTVKILEIIFQKTQMEADEKKQRILDIRY